MFLFSWKRSVQLILRSMTPWLLWVVGWKSRATALTSFSLMAWGSKQKSTFLRMANPPVVVFVKGLVLAVHRGSRNLAHNYNSDWPGDFELPGFHVLFVLSIFQVHPSKLPAEKSGWILALGQFLCADALSLRSAGAMLLCQVGWAVSFLYAGLFRRTKGVEGSRWLSMLDLCTALCIHTV